MDKEIKEASIKQILLACRHIENNISDKYEVKEGLQEIRTEIESWIKELKEIN